MEAFTSVQNYITQIASPNSIHINDYRKLLIDNLKTLKQKIEKASPEFYKIIAKKLESQIKKLDEILKNSKKKKKQSLEEIRNFAIEEITEALLSFFKLSQLVIINYQHFQERIEQKKSVQLTIAYNEFITALQNIITSTHDIQSQADSISDKIIPIFKTAKIAGLIYKNDNLVDEFNLQDAEYAARFTINFAGLLTNKNLVEKYKHAINWLSKKIFTSKQEKEPRPNLTPKEIFAEMVSNLRLLPYNLTRITNQALAHLYQAFTGEDDFIEEFNNIIKSKKDEIYVKIITTASSELKLVKYNFLEKFFLGFNSIDTSANPDTIARTAGNKISINNDYLTNIKLLVDTYYGISASNVKIRKVCLTAIDRITKLILTDDTALNRDLLVSIFCKLPDGIPFLEKVYTKVRKQFDNLSPAKKVEFLQGIVTLEESQTTINFEFRSLLVSMKENEIKQLTIDEINILIHAAKRHNQVLNKRLKGFKGLFRSKHEKYTNCIVADILYKLDKIKREKEEEKASLEQERKMKEDSKRLTLPDEQAQFIETTVNTLDKIIESVEIANNQKIITIINQRMPANAQQLTEQLAEQLKLFFAGRSSQDFQKLKAEAKAILPTDIFTRIEKLTDDELLQIRELLAENNLIKQRKLRLLDNIQHPNQQAFYAMLTNKLDSLFVALRSISTGYIQTYNNQATGMLSAVFSTAGSIIPVVGGLFRGISSVLNWANQKRLMIEAKDVSAIALTSSDDAELAKSFALTITELLNRHTDKDCHLTQLKSTSVAALVEHVVQKLFVILINENNSDYQQKIYGNYGDFINNCVYQLTQEVTIADIDINRLFENFFKKVIEREQLPKIDAETILKTATINVINDTHEKNKLGIKPPIPNSQRTPMLQAYDTELINLKKEVQTLSDKISPKKFKRPNKSNTNELKSSTSSSIDDFSSSAASFDTVEDKKIDEKKSMTVQANQEQAEKIEVLSKTNDALARKNQELEERVARLEQSIGMQSQISYRYSGSVSPRRSNSPFNLRSSMTKTSATVNRKSETIKKRNSQEVISDRNGSLDFAKNRISIPSRGNVQYKIGEELKDFIYAKDKPGGIEPGFLGFLLDENLGTQVFNLIKRIINSKENPYYKIFVDFIKKSLSIKKDEIQSDQHLAYFLKNHECCRIILQLLEDQKLVPLWLIKQDYEDPKPGETIVTVRAKDVEKTNAYQNGLFGKALTKTAVINARKRELINENVNAILECIGTAVASIFMQVHVQRLLQGKYQAGHDKFMTCSQWQNGFQDFKKKLSNAGYLVRLNAKDEKIIVNHKGKPVHLSDNLINGLGNSKLFMLLSNDRDAVGSTGANKGELNGEIFGIDFGHTFREPNEIVNLLQDDFSIPNLPKKFKNFTIFDDSSLSSCMQAVLILAKLRGNTIEDTIIKSYGIEFAYKLNQVIPDEDKLIFKHYRKYFSDFIEDDSRYTQYVNKINEAEQYYLDAADKVLQVFQKRLHLTAQQIDLLDNLEKLCNSTTNIVEKNGEVVWLNHLKKKSRNIIWQLTVEKDQDNNATNLVFITNDLQAKKILKDFIAKTGNKVQIRTAKKANKVEFSVEPTYFNTVYAAFAETKIADYKNSPLALQTIQALSQRNSLAANVSHRFFVPSPMQTGHNSQDTSPRVTSDLYNISQSAIY